MRLAKVRYEQGFISESQLLQVQMSVNEAIVAKEEMERNVALAEKIYKQAEARFEAGLATPSQVEEARLSLLRTELTLAATKQDYLLAKKEYLLFLDGYLPSGTTVQMGSASMGAGM